MMRSWWRYLRIAWKIEPTGQHYLRRILAIFKFELNGCVAMGAALPGLLWIAGSGLVAAGAGVSLVVGSVAAAVYLFHAASQTSALLAQIRSHLLIGVGEPPFEDECCPRSGAGLKACTTPDVMGSNAGRGGSRQCGGAAGEGECGPRARPVVSR